METLLQNTDDKNLLEKIFHATLTKSEMSFLHQMDFKNVVKLMNICNELLKSTQTDEDQFESLLLWLECLLETHYSTFVVAKDENSTTILQETLNLLSDLDQNISLMSKIMAQTKVMKKKLAIQNNRSVNLMYSVEVLYL